MGSIYASAASVLIWLGRDDAVARFLSFMQSMTATSPGRYDAKLVRAYWYQNKLRQTQLDWSRAWITQEVFLSKSSRMLAGDMEISIDELRLIYILLLKVEKHIPSGPGSPDAERHTSAVQLIKIYLQVIVGNIDEEASMESPARNRGLLDLAFSLSGRGSQEPRDQIYSLRAIAQDGDKVTINYQRSNQDCILHTLKAFRKNMCFCSLPFLARMFGRTPSMENEGGPQLPDVTIALPIKTWQSQQDPESLDWDKEWLALPGAQCLHVWECALIIAKDGSNLRVYTKSSEDFAMSISNLVVVTRKKLRETKYVVVKHEQINEGNVAKPAWDNKPLKRVEEKTKLETILEISMPLDSWIRIASAFEADGPAKTELCSESRWGWDSPLSIGLGGMVLPARTQYGNAATRRFQRHPMISR